MPIKLLIIGGVAGGATAAARARRLDEHAEIIIFERGEHISFANCGLPYYIGGVIENRDDLLVTTLEAFRERYHIDIRIFSEVTAIDAKNKQVEVKKLTTGETYKESYDKIILSPGAEPLKPPLEGIELRNIFNLRNIPDSDQIKAYVDTRKPESAVVVGGGFIGLEMAENLVHRGVSTTIVEMLDQVMPPLDHEMAAIVQAHLKEKGVTCDLGNSVESFSEKGERIIVSTKKGNDIECDMVILSVGVRPENKLAKELGLEIGTRGGIKVDATMRTSDPNIYAVGDAVEVKDFVTGLPTMTALAGPANKQGRIAADNVLGRKSVFRGTLGTAVVKVFDMTVASTGASEKLLKNNNIPYLLSYTHSGSHASYYPGAEMMAIKLIFSPGSGEILGAQIVGMEGVDKRIDILATAIRGTMTVYDLEELELAYAPPYGSAKDPVNIAGFVASNMLKGDVENMNWDEVSDLEQTGYVLIDLRNKDELDESGSISTALHIPLHELRKKLPELEKDKNYIAFCAIGLRGYVAYRILTQNGFKSKNLSGGYKTYLGAREKIMKESSQTPLWLGE
ncbi:FAD-dependent oxidoreductase [Desulfonema magnum]|uniref:FAD/NAD(P)-binding domain-containing protein n=1 Tax=Desulfonema magnum TaxID=45655 RepID=A0A975BGK7_9BACT|nr:FAD-dependent oxidoreductase [Desulfonema magnum]QTA85132.1 FAD/NAD(P)-binding domain-containing protein [Desulfonema magnum]